MNTSSKNPCGLQGFAFLEFAGPDENALKQQFLDLGFNLKSAHKNQAISLFQQNKILFIVNASKFSQAALHAETHGPGASAMGFKVADAEKAYDYAIKHGALAFQDCKHADHGLPAIQAIGGSVIFFVDDNHQPFMNSWDTKVKKTFQPDCGLQLIDHLTHNVHRGNMDTWADFYKDIFNFKEIRFFNIKGKMTGLVSRALASPCGKIKIPLNESKDEHSQIEEFLHEYHGEGIQHIALSTKDIYCTVAELRKNKLGFLDVPKTYYGMIDSRIPWHEEPLSDLERHSILIDGEKDSKKGLLLQIFTKNIFGPVFFEIIQRKGNEGFGEGNFQALFEAIERDQVLRGSLKEG